MADFLDAPAMDPPPGEVQNLDNPPNHNDAVIAVYTVSIAIATIFVVLRLYAKFVLLKVPRIEDYLLIPTFGVYIAHCVFWLQMTHTTGHFVHMWDFRVGGLAPFYRNGFYGTILYEAVMLAIKPLILLEWIHIFSSAGPRNLFTWTCYAVAAVNVLMYIISILIDSVSCTPRAYWWDQTIPGGHCIDTKDLPTVTGTLNAVIDLFILLLPQGIIWRLHLPTNKRIGVSIVFLVGAISVISAIARTAISFLYAGSSDVTYNFSLAGIFCLIEMTAAIIVFASPTIPKPMVHLAKQTNSGLSRLLRSTRGGGTFASRGSGDRSKTNVYENIDENGNSMSLRKLRSNKSRKSLATQKSIESVV
ncbi:hypothetical protein F5Y05DRAFT_287312 [Hypoxylon sp. FL0543]|nr:hypothetical protein F5Y05DRAFT_287312 [Hypoxylon sp. FL0543]